MKLKKLIVCAACLVLSVFLLASCTDKKEDGKDTEPVFYTVTFNTNKGSSIEPVKVKENSTVSEPTAPVKEGYVFGGWKYEGRDWIFDASRVTGDMTLDAVWLSPSSIFEHTPIDDATTMITGIKKKVDSIDIPETLNGYTVTAVGDGAFANISSDEVSSIYIPKTVTHIESEAFSGSSGIKITVKGSLLAVGEKAFFNCDGLYGEITLAEGLERISAEAFAGSAIESVKLPKSLKVIEENAFDNCQMLDAVTVHSDITAIEDMAFFECEVSIIYAYGSDADIDAIFTSKLASNNDGFSDNNVYVYSETEPVVTTKYSGFWYIDAHGQTRIWSDPEE